MWHTLTHTRINISLCTHAHPAQEMGDELALLKSKGAPASSMVQKLVKMAFDASVDKKRSTPYSKVCWLIGDRRLGAWVEGSRLLRQGVRQGGKKDGITVMVTLHHTC